MDIKDSIRIASLAYANADKFKSDAELLGAHESYGHAISLTVLGREEAAKSFYFWFVSLGAFPGIPSVMEKMLVSHGPKLAISTAFLEGDELYEAVEKLVDAFVAETAILNREALNSSESDVWKAVAQLLRVHLPRIRDVIGRLQLDKVQDRVCQSRELNVLKQRGFYVDFSFDSAEVSSPEAISQSVFQEHLDRLVESLKICGALLAVCNNSEAIQSAKEHLAPLLLEVQGN